MVASMKGCRPLTDVEVTRIAGSFDGPWALRDRALFVLGHRTGFRVMELLCLTAADVLRAGSTGLKPVSTPIEPSDITERITVARRNMKRKREGRTVVVHPEARTALAAWLEDLRVRVLEEKLDAETPVFCSRARSRADQPAPTLPFGDLGGTVSRPVATTGPLRPISRVQAWRILHAAYHRSDVFGQTGTHSMRKTFARRVHRRSGGDLVTTQRALGHRNIASTMAYLAAVQDDVDKAILSD